MDVLTFETCWEINSEIIKQVTSSWSVFIQLSHEWSILWYLVWILTGTEYAVWRSSAIVFNWYCECKQNCLKSHLITFSRIFLFSCIPLSFRVTQSQHSFFQKQYSNKCTCLKCHIDRNVFYYIYAYLWDNCTNIITADYSSPQVNQIYHELRTRTEFQNISFSRIINNIFRDLLICLRILQTESRNYYPGHITTPANCH